MIDGTIKKFCIFHVQNKILFEFVFEKINFQSFG